MTTIVRARIIESMVSQPSKPFDVVVIGAGPAGVVAALRAARLGARTALVTRDEFGGMAANDGPVPVRTLAQAARLVREARQLPRYGIEGCEPVVDYSRLLARVRDVTEAVRRYTLFRDDLERAGVTIHEGAGTARFLDAHTIESETAPLLYGDKVIICTGGTSRRLPAPGFELTATHSDAWQLSSVPRSLLVIGAGATGVQLAVLGPTTALSEQISPIGSFTDPEYASVGMTESAAGKSHEVVVVIVRFDSLPRPIVDGRETGFCKLIVDRECHSILGCHIVGERAVELAQAAAIVMSAEMPVEKLALMPFSFPTYANALGRAAIAAAIELDDTGMWALDHLRSAEEVGIT